MRCQRVDTGLAPHTSCVIALASKGFMTSNYIFYGVAIYNHSLYCPLPWLTLSPFVLQMTHFTWHICKRSELRRSMTKKDISWCFWLRRSIHSFCPLIEWIFFFLYRNITLKIRETIELSQHLIRDQFKLIQTFSVITRLIKSKSHSLSFNWCKNERFWLKIKWLKSWLCLCGKVNLI